MGAARSLEGADLLVNLERAGDDDHRHVRQQVFHLRQEIEPALAVSKHVVEDDQGRPVGGQHRERLRGGARAKQVVVPQRLLIQLVLEVVVLNHENAFAAHGPGQDAPESGENQAGSPRAGRIRFRRVRGGH